MLNHYHDSWQLLTTDTLDFPLLHIYSSHLPSHRPFRTTAEESQAGISGSIRTKNAPFLWFFLMGIRDFQPDSDSLLKCPVKLSALNWFVFEAIHLTVELIKE